MTPRVAILDYGCGNLRSVVNAMREVGGEPFIAGRWPLADEPQPTHVILPGQGHFGEARENLKANEWMLDLARERNLPILGICLGMQLMCEGSEEAPGVKGLGWLPYEVKRLQVKHLPHIGWNRIYARRSFVPPGETAPVDLGEGLYGEYYFCHSYAIPWTQTLGMGSCRTEYQGYSFLSYRIQPGLWAVQFHPEKSGKAGLAFLREFLTL